MMHMSMQTTVSKQTLLAKLRENRSRHVELFEESKKGYFDRAQKLLNEKLDDLRKGKLIQLRVDIYVPENHVSEYDTAIQMLEWNTSDEVTLSATEFRMFVEDEWDWMHHWLLSNSVYSAGTQQYASSKGL